MMHIKIFEDFQKDKGYLGDDLGIMYHPELKIMYVGSSKDNQYNYTIKTVDDEKEAFEIKTALKDLSPDLWKDLLIKSGYEVLSGDEYFNVTREKRK